MNKSFKVVFNKARGALMVVNEVTSCVQAKGTKTVIAAAVAALAAGVAGATEIPALPEGVTPDTEEVTDWKDIDAQNVFKTEAQKIVMFHTVKDQKVFEGDLWVVSEGEKTSAKGFYVVDADADFINKGNIYIASDASWKNQAILADAGGKATNEGLIVAKNAYGMTVGTTGNGDKGSTIINNGRIVVEETGVGMELGGFDGSTALNEGTIVVNSPSDAEGAFTHGVLIKDQDKAVFTNKGTIDASAEGATAIEVQVTHNTDGQVTGSTAGTELNFEAGSQIVGEVYIQDGVEGTVINANGFNGTLDLRSESEDLELNVVKGAEVTLTDKNGSQVAVANVKDGRLNASIWGEDTKFSKVNVEENGVFNVTKLNSTWDDPATEEDEAKAEGAKKDQLLIKGADYTLNGGKLFAEGENYEGNLKVGTNSEKGSLTITKGDYKYENVRLGNSTKTDGASTLTVAGGNLTVTGLLDLRYGQTTVDGGKLALEGEYLTGKNKGTLAVKSGTFATSGANLFDEVKAATQAEEAAGDETTGEEEKPATKYEVSDLLANNAAQMTGGIIEVTDEGLELSQAQVMAAADMLKTAGIGSNLVFSDVTFTDDKLVFDDALGLNGKGQVIHAGESAEGVTTLEIGEKVAAVGQLVVDKDTTSVVVSKGDGDSIGMLQLTGTAEGGNVIAGGKDGKVATLDAAALKLGWDETSVGTVNVDEAKAYQLEVVGDFSANDVVIKKFNADQEFVSTIAEGAALSVDDLSMEEGAQAYFSVDGTLAANTIGVDVDLNNGSTLVLGQQKVNENARVEVKVPQIQAEVWTAGAADENTGKIEGSHGVVVTTDEGGEALLKAAAANAGVVYDDAKNVGLYADQTIALDREKGQLLVGDMNAATKVDGQVALGSNAVAVIDVKSFDAENAVFDANRVTFNKDAKIVLAGADRISTIKFVEDGIVDGTANFVSTNAWLAAGTEHNAETGDTMLNVAFHGTGDAALDGFAESVLTTGSESLGVINAIGTVYNENGTLSEVGEEALYEYMALPVIAGTYNAAYDAAEQVWNSVSARNIARSAKANGLWADVFYASNEAKDMYDEGYGYEADVYGGVLGYDYTASCGGKIGAALTIGTSDVDGTGDTIGKYGNDADFWGLSVYGSKNITDKMIVSADLTYLSLDNDITGSVAGASVEESIDSSVLSVGLRADWKAYESNAFEIVPHAGIRYAQIDVDDYREFDGESLDVLEMPVGVAFNGKFEAAGMKFVPTLDFTVVPQIGDKDVKTFDGDTLDVLNNTYNTTLGISAEYGDFTFGVAAKYGFGTDDRSNAGVKVNATYAF